MISETVYLDYLSNLLEGNKPKCAEIVKSLLEEGVSPKELYTGLFQRSMERVGKLWEADRICGATEHLATSITECLMSLTYPSISEVEKNAGKVIVACVPREFHQVGAKMVADMFELNGWKSYCLGANTKTSELLRLTGEIKPDLLALSVSLYLNILRFQKVVEEVHFKYPDLEIIAGGKAFQNIKEDFSKKYPYLQVINSIQDLEKFICSYKIKEKTSI